MGCLYLIPSQNHFSERLAFLRAQRKLSQYKLADMLGFSRGLLANYEQGRREPDYNTLLTLASFFNVSVDFMLGNANNENACADKNIDLLHSIDELSLEGKSDLMHYIELLQIRDAFNAKQSKKST